MDSHYSETWSYILDGYINPARGTTRSLGSLYHKFNITRQMRSPRQLPHLVPNYKLQSFNFKKLVIKSKINQILRLFTYGRTDFNCFVKDLLKTLVKSSSTQSWRVMCVITLIYQHHPFRMNWYYIFFKVALYFSKHNNNSTQLFIYPTSKK